MGCDKYLTLDAKLRLDVLEDVRWGSGVSSTSLGAELGRLE